MSDIALQPLPALAFPGSADDLIARAAEGSAEAFAQLYDLMAPAVYGLAKRVLHNAAMAEEATRDALLDVWRMCPTFDSSRRSAKAWILTIAHRRAVDVVRSEQAERTRIARAGIHSWSPDYDVVSEAAMDNVGDAQLAQAFGLLTALQRQAVQLAYYGGLTNREIAEALGVPLGTAKSRIRDGVNRLRFELAVAQQ